MNNTLTHALAWLGLGVSPLPIKPGTKRPLVESWRQHQTALPSVEIVEQWFSRDNIGLAIICGWSGLTILDFDDLAQYGRFIRLFPREARTYTVATSRGMHCYYYSDEPHSTNLGLAPGIDVKGSGGYVLAPPSIHVDGTPYTEHMHGEVIRLQTVDTLLEPFVIKRPERTELQKRFIEAAEKLKWPLRLSSIQEIKRRIPVLDLVSRFTDPRPSSNDGRWFIARCPAPDHLDREPSFWIDARSNICSCYSSDCRARQPGGGKPMDVINLYSRLYGVSNREAITALSQEVVH